MANLFVYWLTRRYPDYLRQLMKSPFVVLPSNTPQTRSKFPKKRARPPPRLTATLHLNYKGLRLR